LTVHWPIVLKFDALVQYGSRERRNCEIHFSADPRCRTAAKISILKSL